MKPTLLFLVLSCALVSCAQNQETTSKEAKELHGPPMGRQEERKENFGKILGDDAFRIDLARGNPSNGSGMMGVNPHLWKASFETVHFIPLVSSDAVGGVIITDWYTSPNAPNERLKITIRIIGTELKTDALSVSVFKQIKSTKQEWAPAQADEKLARDFEDVILSRARDIRIASAAAGK